MALPPGPDLPVADEDRAYFERRAEEEIERARECTNPKAVAAHYALSELYLDRIEAVGEGKDGCRTATDDDAGPPHQG